VNRIRFRTAEGGWRSLDVGANNLCHDPRVRGFVFVLGDAQAQGMMDAVYDAMVSGESIESIATRIAALLRWQTGGCPTRVVVHGLGDVHDGEASPDSVPVRIEVEDLAEIVVHHPPQSEPSEWLHLLMDRAAGLLRVAVARRLGEQAMRRRLDEKTAIISAVSHDLRSPIAAISLMSSLLDGSNDALTPEQRRDLAQRIANDARRTSRLLTDLTSMDRLLHGSADLHLQCVHLVALVERVVDEVEASDHCVSVDGRPADLAAQADPVLLERVVDNLLANALKHTPEGTRADLRVTPTGALLVRDHGPGIPASERSSVFKRFWRKDRNAEDGAGLGLAIAAKIVEAHGGQLSVSGAADGGAVFAIDLVLISSPPSSHCPGAAV
jgi:signal transduction histidine kinase